MDCKKCKDYKCPGKEWYSYGDIRWCPFQVYWIIEYLETLKEGIWPDFPDSSSYTDPSMIGQLKPEGYFVKACLIAGELEARLKKTKLSGKLLVAEIRAGIIHELSEEAKSALYYVTGRRMKQDPYSAWKAKRRWRQKDKNIHLVKKT